MKKSRVQLKIKGLNQERAINKLSKSVSLLKVDRQDKQVCVLEVSPKDIKKARKLLQEDNFEIVQVKDYGVYSIAKKLRSYYGVLAGLVLCFCAYFVQLGFVWQVKVYGNERLSTSEITQFIDDNLVSRYISKIDTKNLEIGLREQFKRISSVSVAVVGQSIVVNINEAVLPEEMGGDFEPLVSNFDCRITEIKLVQGTLNFKVGDIVRAGETLVEPYIIDSEGQLRAVKPMASIKADVWIESSSEHFDSYYQTSHSGKSIEMSEVYLFGVKVYSNVKPVTFKQYELEEELCDLNKNNLLPFKLRKLRYYETKTELIEQNFEEVKEQIISATREKALQNLQECEIIKEEDCTITEAGGVHIVRYVLTVNREIVGGI